MPKHVSSDPAWQSLINLPVFVAHGHSNSAWSYCEDLYLVSGISTLPKTSVETLAQLLQAVYEQGMEDALDQGR